ncbi:MAG: hypothetical protein HRT66_03400 [Flavobacteriaceae bacterium]|nr:hypothetical protein [Flavobacteriaceae bacterium]
MKINKTIIYKFILIAFIGVFLSSCASDEEEIVVKDVFDEVEEATELDLYLHNEFLVPYSSAIIYKYIDKYIDPTKKAVPARLEIVKPIAELIKTAWIKPYNVAAVDGEDFLKVYFPAEVILLGGPLYNGDGTVTLGTADAGARITFTDVNSYILDPQTQEEIDFNKDWITRAFRTLHHEFAHIVDQSFNFEAGQFSEISSDGYTSPGSWTSVTNEQAIASGMVTPYGTSQVGEDFAELFSFIITTPIDEFEATYITPQTGDSDDTIEGKTRIAAKREIVVDYMNKIVRVDIYKLRDEFLKSVQ